MKMFGHSQDVWTQSVWILLRSTGWSDAAWRRWKSHARVSQFFFESTVYHPAKNDHMTKWIGNPLFPIGNTSRNAGVLQFHCHGSLPEINLKEVWCVTSIYFQTRADGISPVFCATLSPHTWPCFITTCIYRYLSTCIEQCIAVFIHTKSGVFRCFFVSPSFFLQRSQSSYEFRHQQGLSMQDHVRVRFWLEANLEFDHVHGFRVWVRVVFFFNVFLFTSWKDNMTLHVKGF